MTQNIFKKAHTMTREIKNNYPEVNYRTQFALCLKDAYREERIAKLAKSLRAQGCKVNRWTKGTKDRLYVEGFHYSKSFFVELTNSTAKANRPGADTEMNLFMKTAGCPLTWDNNAREYKLTI